MWRAVGDRKQTGRPQGLGRPPSSSLLPKVLEPVGLQFGIPDRVLNALVAEVVLLTLAPGSAEVEADVESSPTEWRKQID